MFRTTCAKRQTTTRSNAKIFSCFVKPAKNASNALGSAYRNVRPLTVSDSESKKRSQVKNGGKSSANGNNKPGIRSRTRQVCRAEETGHTGGTRPPPNRIPRRCTRLGSKAAVFVGSTRYVSTPQYSTINMAKTLRDPQAPKKCLSAYMLFQSAHREAYRIQNPTWSIGEIAKHASAEYSKLPGERTI